MDDSFICQLTVLLNFKKEVVIQLCIEQNFLASFVVDVVFSSNRDIIGFSMKTHCYL